MPFSTRVMRDEDWAAIKHFKASEFKHPYAMGFEMMQWLDQLRAQAGVPIHITSSYRSAAHNAAFPLPITTTSYESMVVSFGGDCTTRPDAIRSQ